MLKTEDFHIYTENVLTHNDDERVSLAVVEADTSQSNIVLTRSGQTSLLESNAPLQSLNYVSDRVETARDVDTSCRVSTTSGKSIFHFTSGNSPVMNFEVPVNARSLASATMHAILSDLQTRSHVHLEFEDKLAELCRELLAIPSAECKFPERSVGGDLLLELSDELPWSIRSQLFAGFVHSNPELKQVSISDDVYLAAALCGCEAVYFVARGCRPHQVVAVQLFRDSEGSLMVYATTGFGEISSWRVTVDINNESSPSKKLQMVANYLVAVSDGERLSDPFGAISLEAHTGGFPRRLQESIEHLSNFLTIYKAAAHGVASTVLDVPVVVSRTQVVQTSRSSAAVIVDHNSEAAAVSNSQMAIIADKVGLFRIYLSNPLNSKQWAMVWSRAPGDKQLTKVAHVKDLLKEIAVDTEAREFPLRIRAFEPKADNLLSSLAERMRKLFGTQSSNSHDDQLTTAA